MSARLIEDLRFVFGGGYTIASAMMLSVRLQAAILPDDVHQAVVMALGRKPLVLNPLPDFVTDWPQPCPIILPFLIGAEGQDGKMAIARRVSLVTRMEGLH